jgi:hypothetical protein
MEEAMTKPMRVFRLLSNFVIPAGTPGQVIPPHRYATNKDKFSILVALDKDHTAELSMFLADALKLGLVEEDK